MGELNWLLGTEVKRTCKSHPVTLSQHVYINKILNCFNLQDAKLLSTPLDSHVKDHFIGPPDSPLTPQTPYSTPGHPGQPSQILAPFAIQPTSMPSALCYMSHWSHHAIPIRTPGTKSGHLWASPCLIGTFWTIPPWSMHEAHHVTVTCNTMCSRA